MSDKGNRLEGKKFFLRALFFKDIFLLLILLFLSSSCSKHEFQNPFDPDSGFTQPMQGQLSLILLSDSEVRLQWVLNPTIVGNYIIRKKVNNGDFEHLAIVDKDTNRYTDSCLLTFNTYYYQLIGANGDVHTPPPTNSIMIFPYYEPEWSLIPAGNYTYGSGNTILNIDYDYKIMKYEVTNAQYLAYLQQAYAAGDIWVSGSGVQGYYPGDEHLGAGNYLFYSLGTWLYSNTSRISDNNGQFTLNYPSQFTEEDYLNHPVVYVTWFGAWHFANYYGWRLPTEHEWEKAARGMTGYDYPWGNTIDGSRANYGNNGDPWDNGTTPVGFYSGQSYQGFQTSDSPGSMTWQATSLTGRLVFLVDHGLIAVLCGAVAGTTSTLSCGRGTATSATPTSRSTTTSISDFGASGL